MRKFLYEQIEEIPEKMICDFRNIISVEIPEYLYVWGESQFPENRELAKLIRDNIDTIESDIRNCMRDSVDKMLFLLSADAGAISMLEAYEENLSALEDRFLTIYGDKFVKVIKFREDGHWRADWIRLLFNTISTIELRASITGPNKYRNDGKSIVQKRL